MMMMMMMMMTQRLHDQSMSRADLVAFNTADSQRRQLRSSQTRAAVVKRTRTQFGKRAFSACGPNIWNCFPPAVRNIDSYPASKSHLFQCAFIAQRFIPVYF